MTKIERHQVADLFPMMSDECFQNLKADIQAHGQREDITVWKGQLVDGRHRLRACAELGIEPQIAELMDETDPVAWAISHNLHRRHLSPSQLAMVADKVRGIYDEEGKAAKVEGGKSAGKNRPKSKDAANLPQANKRGKDSRDKAAEAVGVSGKLADAAKKVRSKGTEELQQAVESGEVSVTAAALVADLPQEKQAEIVSREDVKQAAADIRTEKKRAAESARGADETAVKALLSAANPLSVIEKAIAKFSQVNLTVLYLRCEELLDKFEGKPSR
jgi:ParB-like chromosome segregation protein Spo0J